MIKNLNLSESDAFLQLSHIVDTPIYWKDEEGHCLGCNPKFLQLMVMTNQEQIIGKKEAEFWNCIDNNEAWLESDLLALRDGQSEMKACQLVGDTNKKIYLSILKARITANDSKVVGILCSVTDMVEEVPQEMSAHTDSLTEQIIDNVNACIYWKDRNGRFLGCNKYVLEVAGVTEKNQLIGKKDLDFWEVAAVEIEKIDMSVLQNGRYAGEEIITTASGKETTFFTVKNQLHDSKGNVIGLIGTSLDITSQKEADRLKLENKCQLIALNEKEKFAQLARKVAHDINSPLAALKIMSERCDELPENKRSLLKRATEGIIDIANNLIHSYQISESSTASAIEARQPFLVSDQLVQLLSEKKVQYQQCPISFETVIADDAHYAFILMQKTEFRRSMSNLINNAVDALEKKDGGVVTVELTANVDSVVVKIQDNGKGMPRDKVEKMLAHQGFTEGKKEGHGLGLQQVWDTLKNNKGVMAVHSELGQGTSIQLTFPRIATSAWIAQKIHLIPDNTIVILDDDDSIHAAWNLRFTDFLASHPTLQIHHFTQGQEVLDFLATLNQEERNRVIFLSDYELLRQNRNGLQIVEASEIKGAMLVTSYYDNPKIQGEAGRLKIKILPKQMASVIPIFVN